MSQFKKEEIGLINEISKNYENGKVFFNNLLGLTSCEISINEMPSGVNLPFSHKHKQNEEVYIFLKGEGSMTLDNEIIDVKEGTCIKVLPNASRTIQSKTNLQYICIQAKSNSLEQFGLEDAELC